jgi:hypothetical protein
VEFEVEKRIFQWEEDCATQLLVSLENVSLSIVDDC